MKTFTILSILAVAAMASPIISQSADVQLAALNAKYHDAAPADETSDPADLNGNDEQSYEDSNTSAVAAADATEYQQDSAAVQKQRKMHGQFPPEVADRSVAAPDQPPKKLGQKHAAVVTPAIMEEAQPADELTAFEADPVIPVKHTEKPLSKSVSTKDLQVTEAAPVSHAKDAKLEAAPVSHAKDAEAVAEPKIAAEVSPSTPTQPQNETTILDKISEGVVDVVKKNCPMTGMSFMEVVQGVLTNPTGFVSHCGNAA